MPRVLSAPSDHSGLLTSYGNDGRARAVFGSVGLTQPVWLSSRSAGTCPRTARRSAEVEWCRPLPPAALPRPPCRRRCRTATAARSPGGLASGATADRHGRGGDRERQADPAGKRGGSSAGGRRDAGKHGARIEHLRRNVMASGASHERRKSAQLEGFSSGQDAQDLDLRAAGAGRRVGDAAVGIARKSW